MQAHGYGIGSGSDNRFFFVTPQAALLLKRGGGAAATLHPPPIPLQTEQFRFSNRSERISQKSPQGLENDQIDG
jgi:hypothetical protein